MKTTHMGYATALIVALGFMTVMLVIDANQRRDEPRQVAGRVTEPVHVSHDTRLPEGALTLQNRPAPELSRPIHGDPDAPSPAMAQRMNASSPAALVASLRDLEGKLSPMELNRLRVAMTTGQMLMAQKIAALSMGGTSQPELSDDQLFRMAFGHMHGMTVAEVIDHGEKVLPTLTTTVPPSSVSQPASQGSRIDPALLGATPLR